MVGMRVFTFLFAGVVVTAVAANIEDGSADAWSDVSADDTVFIQKQLNKAAVLSQAESSLSLNYLRDAVLGAGSMSMASVVALFEMSRDAAPHDSSSELILPFGVKPSTCPADHAAVPLTFLATAMLVALVWLRRQAHARGLAEVARCAGLYQQFCGMCNYSVVILESYNLCKALGHTAAFSGQLIGIYMMAAAIGGSIMAIMLRISPKIWKHHAKDVLICAQVFNLAGFCIYSWVSARVSYNAIDTPEEAAYLAMCLMMSRAMSGVGHGFCAQLLQLSFAHLTPREERPSQMVRFFFVNTLGIGLGPLIAAAMRSLEYCPAHLPHRFMVTGLSQLVMAIAAVVAVAVYYPRLDECEDYVETESLEARAIASTPDAKLLQKVILIGCMVNTLIRAFVTSGVEGATSLLLQTEYGWATGRIGIVIGATFLCCFPAKLVIDGCKNYLTTCQWVQLLCSISVFASMLLLHRSWLFLIVADVLLFPSLYLSDGMVRGLMQQYALPSGSIFDQNHTTLWAMLLNSLGRYLGPWMARALLEGGVQTAYASLQISLTVGFWIVFKFMVVRPARSEDMKLLWHSNPPSPREINK